MADWRFLAVLAAFVAAVALIMVRVVFLQVVEGDFLQHEGDARTIRIETTQAHRGMIEDRHGRPLAISSPVGSVWVNPQRYVHEPGKGEQLAAALDMTPQALAERLQQYRRRSFVYLKRHLRPQVVDRIRDLGIAGIGYEREFQRFYPAGEVAAHVLGFTDIDDTGQEGIELAFDGWLRGRDGARRVLRDKHGRTVRDLALVKEVENGRALSLSLDLRIQFAAYRELKAQVQRLGARAGSAVVLDAGTGEVLAMVNQPAFNPNNRATMLPERVRNRAVADVFEPGSTAKPLAMAAALASGRFGVDSVVDTSPGFVHVDGYSIRDPVNYRRLSMTEVIAKSSQVGITHIALSLPVQALPQLYRQVGFGAETAVGLVGEQAGSLVGGRELRAIEIATWSYGYGFTVTPLQLARAYLMLANDGMLLPVSLLRVDEPVEGEQVLDRRIARQIKRMLQAVVEDGGTGERAVLQSYSVAGKTGTARKIGKEGGYDDTRHLAFFAGFAPVDNARLVAAVVIDEPRSKGYSGGKAAAPVFRRIMQAALPLLSVAPDLVPVQQQASSDRQRAAGSDQDGGA